MAVAVGPAHLIAPPAQPDDLSLEFVHANTKVISIHGKIVELARKTRSLNLSPMLNGRDLFRADYAAETCNSMKVCNTRRRGVALIQVHPHGLSCDALFEAMRPQCNFVAAGRSVIPSVGDVFSAVYHRNTQRALDIRPFVVVELVLPKTIGQHATHRDDITFKFIEAWVRMQTEVVSNFTVVHAKKYNGAVVMEEWASRDQFAIDADINECQSTTKRQRTLREAYISENHVQLVRMWKGMTTDCLLYTSDAADE